MGVRGLKTFIESNEDLTIRHELLNSSLIIDANNVKTAVYIKAQAIARDDIFGGDLVRFAYSLKVFFNDLRRAKVAPIFVFDGAKDITMNDKTAKQHERAIARYQLVDQIARTGNGEPVIPMNTSFILHNLILTYGFEVVPCMYDADNEIARLAKTMKCPVLSNDTDFFLMDLPEGVIIFDSVGRPIFNSHDKRTYIPCTMYKAQHFVTNFPGLDTRSLPLLGILCGNDYVERSRFESTVERFPNYEIYAEIMDRSQFTRSYPHSQRRILKILFFLRYKTTPQAINRIAAIIPGRKSGRSRHLIVQMLRENCKFYQIPKDNDFLHEMMKLCECGASDTIAVRKWGPGQFEVNALKVTSYFEQCFKKHALTSRTLEIMQRNIMFAMPFIDDRLMCSTNSVTYPAYQLIMRLTRTSHKEFRPLLIYDRVDQDYTKVTLFQMESLPKFGPIDYLIYDLPLMDYESRLCLVLATFNCTFDEYRREVAEYYNWFEPSFAQQVFIIDLLLQFGYGRLGHPRLSNVFIRAVKFALIFYAYEFDESFETKCDLEFHTEFMVNMRRVINNFKLDKPSRSERYTLTIVHEISQLMASFWSFNAVNSILFEPFPRLRLDRWLNSALIYNLTYRLTNKQLIWNTVPYIVDHIINVSSSD